VKKMSRKSNTETFKLIITLCFVCLAAAVNMSFAYVDDDNWEEEDLSKSVSIAKVFSLMQL
jgi:hypothetical protein